VSQNLAVFLPKHEGHFVQEGAELSQMFNQTSAILTAILAKAEC